MNALYKKDENFSRILFEELFEVESKQKPACGAGLHRWVGSPTHISTDVSRETFYILVYAIQITI